MGEEGGSIREGSGDGQAPQAISWSGEGLGGRYGMFADSISYWLGRAFLNIISVFSIQFQSVLWTSYYPVVISYVPGTNDILQNCSK